MKKSLLVLLLLIFVSSSVVFAQDNNEQSEKEYSHAQVAATGYVPYFGTMLMSLSELFVPQDLMMHYISTESILLNIPAAIVNPSYTLTGTAISTTSWST